VRLHRLERGAASDGLPSLVFLHHFGGSSRTWDAVVALLSDRFHCVAVDLRGYGDSGAAQEYSVGAMADDLLEVVRDLRLARVELIGHSMGGKVALSVAARQPAELERLVLVAPSPPTPEPIEARERERLLRAHGDRAEAAHTNREITRLPIPVSTLETLLDDNLRCQERAWNAWLTVGSREDISAAMPQVTQPTLVVAGGADPVLPAAILEREVRARLPNASLEVIPKTGHLLPLEVPVELAALIGRRHDP
jgi:pimeloyl-ACP methyl ester carboxylesterase